MICSTLSGMMAIKHPTLGVLVREDGMVLRKGPGNNKAYGWTRGSLHKDGYRGVVILGKHHMVHRIVAEAFIPNTNNKPTVDHINRVRDDNRVQNLRWATHKEQMDNSGKALSRVDYGVRACDNIAEYRHEYHKAHRDYYREYQRKFRKSHREELREYARKRYQNQKQEKLAAKESQ